MTDKNLNMIEHLDELRKRIIITLVAFIAFFILGFCFVEEIYHWFVQGLDTKLIVLGPGEIVGIYFKIASIVAIAGTIPVLAWQIWLFVRPALKANEVKVTLSYIPALFILFLVGLSFGYYVIFPSVMHFLIELSGDMFVTNFTADKYFSFLINMSLPFAILFELPVVVMFLTSIGIVNPYVLSKIRKYAYFILVIIAIVITPPDFVSDFLVVIPLLLLYEISISLSKIVYKRRLKRMEFQADLEID
ncbi:MULTISPECIES: twin-arginine translocase subunit TatC [Bacillus]|uniref:twin-arginine translocase subunit TatC n=1 Tax=Bacillus TaxID=1386 RepID=UPI00031954EE|nr:MULTISPECIES: twin-arginine translocase subunit TatC [Bacillus]